MTVAAFMDLALYDPEFGYYARVGRRSGRTGDFFTSVDVGPLFGELLAVQLAEMSQLLHQARGGIPGSFDLVEAGAGNGRLCADILRAAREHDLGFYDAVHLHLVEVSAAARAQQRNVLTGSEHDAFDRPAEPGRSSQAIDVSDRLRSSSAALPDTFEGALIANELLDAMPVHQMVMRQDGLREVFVDDGPAGWRLVEGPPSTSALQEYLDRAGARLEPGWRAEINLQAVDWIRDAALRLRRGFMILIDYGHEARDLYSVSHSGGTLTTFSGHRSRGPEVAGAPAWLAQPGGQDITAHVDFSSVRAAAEAAGLTTVALLDQTYFLLGLVAGRGAAASAGREPDRDAAVGRGHASTERSTALKTLVMPGGLGSTMKVLILGKNVGVPSLKGCSFKVRIT